MPRAERAVTGRRTVLKRVISQEDGCKESMLFVSVKGLSIRRAAPRRPNLLEGRCFSMHAVLSSRHEACWAAECIAKKDGAVGRKGLNESLTSAECVMEDLLHSNS